MDGVVGFSTRVTSEEAVEIGLTATKGPDAELVTPEHPEEEGTPIATGRPSATELGRFVKMTRILDPSA
jgi:hypothetical protein